MSSALPISSTFDRSVLGSLGVLCVAILIAASGVAPAHAQAPGADSAAPEEASAPAVDPLVEQAQALRVEMDGMVERYRALDENVAAAKGEERRVLLSRMADMRLKYLALLHELADNLEAQREKEIATDAFASEVKAEMRVVVGRLGSLITETAQQIQKSRTPLEEVEPAAERALQRRGLEDMKTLDALYRGLQKHLARMERLALDPATGRRWLSRNLEQRADSLAGWVRHLNREIAALQAAADARPDDADLQADLSFEEERLDAITTSFDVTLAIMHDFELDTAEYRQLLIETTGEITGDVLEGDVALRLVKEWSARLRDWFEDNGPQVVFKLLLFAAILLATRVVAGVTRRVVKRAASTSRLAFSKLLQETLVSWVSRVVMLLGLLLALSQIGIDPGPLLAGLGLAGFIVGFALQDTLGNFAAGAMILIYRPYDVGDLVETAGVYGQVSKMSLVSTTILTIDNQTLVVPNSKIWGNVIKNVTDQPTRRVDLKFGIAYSDDIEHAEQVFSAVLSEDDRVLSDPPPLIVVHELANSAVVFKVCPWVRTEDYWDVYWDLTRAVKLRLDREGLHIPFPQRDVHFYAETARVGRDGDPDEG